MACPDNTRLALKYIEMELVPTTSMADKERAISKDKLGATCTPVHAKTTGLIKYDNKQTAIKVANVARTVVTTRFHFIQATSERASA